MPYDPDAAAIPMKPPAPTAMLASELAAVAALLETAFAPAEGTFLAIGDRLATAVDLLGRLTASFADLPRDLEHEDLGKATAQLAGVARAVSAMADALTHERLALDQVCALAGEVTGRIGRLRKTVGIIGVLAINARIAATHIRGSDQDFSVFTNEIARLGKAASATIDRFAADFEHLTAQVRAARADQAEFARRQTDTLRVVAQRLEQSLSSVTAHRLRAAGAVTAIGERSQEIAQGVSAAVMALQIGDITRQRLEHIGHAVEVLVRGLSTAAPAHAAEEPWLSSLPEDRQRQAIGAVCRLQAAQAGAAAAAFDGEIHRIVGTLQTLAADAQAIVGLGLDVYGTADRRTGSFLGDLVADIRDADALIRQCTAARRQVDGVVASVATTLASLLGQMQAVQAVEVDMRLVSLNTALKCGRLGNEGRTLSVIAQELRTYANLTVDDARGVAEGLQAVVAAATALDSQGEAGGAARIAALERETAASVARLEAVGGSLACALDTLAHDGERVTVLLRETASGTAGPDAVGRLMQEIRERLTRIADATGGSAEGLEGIREDVLAQVRGRYTMASERDIHDLFGMAGDATAGNVGQAAPGPVPDADALDDVLF